MVVGGSQVRALKKGFRCMAMAVWIVAVCWGVTHFITPSQPAVAQTVSEDKIRAAIVYKLPLFCTWPKDATRTHFTILFLGDSRAYDFLKPYEGQVVKGVGKPLKLIRLKSFREADEPMACDMLYVGRDQSRLYKRIIERYSKAHVLTVGEDHWFTRYGGVIDIRPVGQRMRWSINKVAAEHSKLLLNAQLYRNAHEVIAPEGGTK